MSSRSATPAPLLLALILCALCFSSLAPGAQGEEVFLRASQVGYRPEDVKTAIAFSKTPLPGSFAIVAVDTHQVVFTGRTRPVAHAQWGQFTNHAELDFSALRTPGRYQVRLGE